MLISDTKPEIQAMQKRIIMAMTGEQRLRLAYDMCCLSRSLAKAGIRRDHPDWSENDIDREFLRLLLLADKRPTKM